MKKPEKLITILSDQSIDLGANIATRDIDAVSSSSSDDVITPIRSNRKGRVKPVLLSSSEGSDSQEVLPASQSNRRNARKSPNGGSIDLSAKDSPQGNPVKRKLQRNDRQYAPRIESVDGEGSDSIVSEARGALVISSGSEASSSDEEVFTPSRRQRNTNAAKSIPADPDTDDLDDEVADLDDNGEFRGSHGYNLRVRCLLRPLTEFPSRSNSRISHERSTGNL